jgi:hypothetical protein
LLCNVLYWSLPNLSLLDIKAEVVHGVEIAPATLAWAAAYGLAYSSAVLILACVVFERRDFN